VSPLSSSCAGSATGGRTGGSHGPGDGGLRGKTACQQEAADDQRGQGADLQQDEGVQQTASRLDAGVVDEGDEDDREDGEGSRVRSRLWR